MIAVISDVHGNYPALKSVIQDIHKYGCERIISLGDIVGYYCMVNECIDLCRKENVVNILGNHDYYLISGDGCPRSYSVNICIRYQTSVITKQNIEWLKNSVDLIENEFFSMRHGGWKNPLDEYINEFSFEMVKGYSQSVFASGHTHKQVIKKNKKKTYFNPGSVGQPRDYDSRAAYAIINDNSEVILKRIKYPINETIEIMRERGFQDRISECLLRGTRIGEEVDTFEVI